MRVTVEVLTGDVIVDSNAAPFPAWVRLTTPTGETHLRHEEAKMIGAALMKAAEIQRKKEEANS